MIVGLKKITTKVDVYLPKYRVDSLHVNGI